MNQPVERELKLVPASADLLDQLSGGDRLGPFTVRARHKELQRNSFFDSASRGLGRARVGFRRRTLPDKLLATWTIKGEGEFLRGVATRSEVELQLAPDLAPALAIGALRDAARSRGAAPLAEAVSDALAANGLPLARPFLETETDRTVLDLEAPDRGWSVEMVLDRVELVGHGYTELEIEVELKRGDEAALEAARDAILALGPARESHESKLSRAVAHLAACHCSDQG